MRKITVCPNSVPISESALTDNPIHSHCLPNFRDTFFLSTMEIGFPVSCAWFHSTCLSPADVSQEGRTHKYIGLDISPTAVTCRTCVNVHDLARPSRRYMIRQIGAIFTNGPINNFIINIAYALFITAVGQLAHCSLQSNSVHL